MVKTFTGTCSKCQITFVKEIKWGYIPKYCSRSCASSRPMSEPQKQKRREWAKANPKGAILNKDAQIKGGKSRAKKQFGDDLTIYYETKNCLECYNPFKALKSAKRKYCSRECADKNRLNKNSTRKTRSIYKGFQMDSGAEKQFAQLLDSNNIKWVKNSKIFFTFIDLKGKKRKYYPDFYLPEFNLWIEVKAKYYLRESDSLRWVSVPNHEVIWYDNIKLPSKIDTHDRT